MANTDPIFVGASTATEINIAKEHGQRDYISQKSGGGTTLTHF